MKTIKLTQGKTALVDDEDFERVNQFNWYAIYNKGDWRARRNIRFNSKRIALLMARYILNVTDPKLDVDHINGVTLDNRRPNLRACTHAENLRNAKKRNDCSSIYKGVSWRKRDKKWLSQICINYKVIYLGCYNDPKLAHGAYCKAATKYFGEFAKFK